MCGISAIVSPNFTRNHNWVLAANRVQYQRGPDDVGRSEAPGDPCVMGHTRLSLVDTSPTGHQPMSYGDLTITFNGEVYNHQELRARCPAYHFQGTSDTESVLGHIAVYGLQETLERMNGMFAFALWDGLERTLYLATDRFGVKPLYVYDEGDVFACASSSAALLELKEKWEVDAEGMAQFFHLGGSARGVWQGIERIGGSQLLTYHAATGHLARSRWYTPTFNPNAAEELEGLITDAIRISAKADVPVGIFYSGGVDTSVVASVIAPSHEPRATSAAARSSQLAAQSPRNVPAFHLDSPERPYAEQGAAHFGLDLHTVQPDQLAVVPALKDIAAKSGEPTMAGYIPWLVSRTAAEYVKACISGNGADELFFGYERTPRTIDNDAYFAQDAHLFRNFRSMGVDPPTWGQSPLGDGFPDDAWGRWRELNFYIQHDLNPTLDAASMCHSLELRVPFLDHRVVEAALSLPASFHGTKRVLKDLLRKAGLPEPFVERKKLGFSMPADHPTVRQYKLQAWAMACRHFGWNPDAVLSPRDRNYLHLCAAGWRAWMDVHQHRIAA